ncbi:hypothetical protein HMPREF1544_09950 [Mucor circinelloides 1006PhL]|uniref:Mid2 domain-containing protein n=1 Tax=Mucor circinelloides f. circinelloides (strain 1006PhL) TaxID=1220926 RepID=S2J154_MUCC1|nr:hypothetical protein HMPREF1544_09950 [Mucor circinelloides 1006PhL]
MVNIQQTFTTVFFALSIVHCQQQQPIPTSTSDLQTTSLSSEKPVFTSIDASSSSSSSSSTCGVNGNTDTICSPKAGDVWKNGTWYPITWNTMYPSYVSSPALDIYIYFVQNYQNILIKKISDINTSKGSVAVLVDDTWRVDPSAQTYESLIYIVPNGINPEKEMANRYSDYPPPIRNLVAQSALVPLTTAFPTATNASSISASASMTNNPSSTLSPTSNSVPIPTNVELSAKDVNNKKETGPEAHPIQPWVIAAVVLACLAVLGACVAIFWVMRHSRRRKLVYGEKGHLELNSTASSSMFPVLQQDGSSKEKLNAMSTISLNQPTINTTVTTPVRFYGTAHTGSERGSLKSHTAPNSPLNNTTPTNMGGFISTPSLPLDGKIYMLGDGARPQSTASFSNISSRSEPPLTSTDALLIADTFRQRMRRPEWQQQQQQLQKKEDEEAEEEDKRRQLSEQLLKKELEAEGTLMKKVGKRAHLLAATYQQQQQP